jgi:hypothetical protein
VRSTIKRSYNTTLQKWGELAHLTSKDNDFVDGSGSFFAQELAHDKVPKGAGADNGKVFVPRHEIY